MLDGGVDSGSGLGILRVQDLGTDPEVSEFSGAQRPLPALHMFIPSINNNHPNNINK